MSFEVTNPFPVFTDLSGEPLENGNIYIGTVLLNPETNPIVVYWDKALTIPATQPIRTLGGYPDRAGTPSRLYVAENSFSITVRDKNNKLVFSELGAVVVVTDVLFYDTIADMTAILKSSLTGNQQVSVGGYAAIGDGGGGIFYWDSTSAATANGGTIIASDEGGTGRWLRIIDDVITVKMFGATGDGVTNDTAAFTATRTLTGGAYFIPSGTYILDVSPDVWDDPFTTGDNVTLTVAGTPFDVSNNFKGQLIAGSWNDTVMNINGARSGEIIFRISDGSASGQSHIAYLPWDIRRDSHSMIFAPETENGLCDLLWRRSASDVGDPFGNRFSATYDDSLESYKMSYATSASGLPSFDDWVQVYNGADATPRIDFPALQANFKQGLTVSARSGATFGVELVATNTTEVRLVDSLTPATIFMTFGASSFGFNGAVGAGRQTVTGSRGGNAALASLLTILEATGLILDGTTA